MKKLWFLVLFAIVACGSKKSDSNTVVVYTPASTALLNPIKEAFTKETGIEVKVLVAGTGELIKRIEAESNNPQGDVFWGGSFATISRNVSLFDDYVSTHEDKIHEFYRNRKGNRTPFTISPSVIMVNTDLVGDIPINGYEDLLNPALKGKIAFADPNLSSSSYDHLVNMLYAMGNGDPENGWWYVEKLMDNIEKKILGGSSAVYKGVGDGEYAVGLTFEEGALNYVAPNKPIKVVYMEEGVIFKANGSYVIKNAPNTENAERFVDFLIGETVQGMVEDLNRRTIRTDIASKGKITPLSEINVLKDDEVTIVSKKQEWLDKFKDILIK